MAGRPEKISNPAKTIQLLAPGLLIRIIRAVIEIDGKSELHQRN